MLDAILFGHKQVVAIIDMIEDLRKQAGLEPKKLPAAAAPNPALEVIRAKYYKEYRDKKQTPGKHARAEAIKELRTRISGDLIPKEGESKYTSGQVASALEAMEERILRDLVLEGVRLDGRNPKQLRQITCEVGVLPHPRHGHIPSAAKLRPWSRRRLATSDEQQWTVCSRIQQEVRSITISPFSVGECRPFAVPAGARLDTALLRNAA